VERTLLLEHSNAIPIAVGAPRVNYYGGMYRVYEVLSGVGDGLNGAINSCL
jgi:hypothetical protein